MDDLIAFLNARLDDDEHFAKVARLAQKHREQMLREVAAKRAIAGVMAETDPLADDSQWSGRAAVHDEAVRHLAAVYSDHPDYRPEWKP